MIDYKKRILDLELELSRIQLTLNSQKMVNNANKIAFKNIHNLINALINEIEKVNKE